MIIVIISIAIIECIIYNIAHHYILCHLTPNKQDLINRSHNAYLHMKETLMPIEDREAEADILSLTQTQTVLMTTLKLIVTRKNFKPY